MIQRYIEPMYETTKTYPDPRYACECRGDVKSHLTEHEAIMREDTEGKQIEVGLRGTIRCKSCGFDQYSFEALKIDINHSLDMQSARADSLYE